MKTIVLFFSLLIVTNSFAQDVTTTELGSKFYLGTNFYSNITGDKNLGMGLKVSLGYSITENLSVDFSSGYMTSFTDPHTNSYRVQDESGSDYIIETHKLGRMDHQFIPINLSVNYKFDLWGVQPYTSLMLGYDYYLNSGNFTFSSEKKYESTNQLIESSSGLYNEIFDTPKAGFASFHMGLGVGVLVPVSNQIKLDFSFQRFSNVNSIGVGLNYRIK
ncbi:MAG: hypothetical protein IPH97_15520 [Ignavibacteriales bacterium]|nr:hypothetical protein [Ignavibacteriales bacterium]